MGYFVYCITGTVAALASGQYSEVGSHVSRGNESLVFKGVYHRLAAIMESNCERVFLTFFFFLASGCLLIRYTGTDLLL